VSETSRQPISPRRTSPSGVHPLDASRRILDEGDPTLFPNRVTNELSELADDLAVIESFSHVLAWRTADGITCFDTSNVHTGPAVVGALRGWSGDRVSRIVYTHGHADHVGGSTAFAADADAAGRPRPTVLGHARVRDRLARYRDTSDWNLRINARQFGGINSDANLHIGAAAGRFLPDTTLEPDTVYDDELVQDFGGERVELRHARGETDDHTWAWVPGRKWAFVGDFVIWNFPNAGNPQKVQRYPLEWARALRDMVAEGPELLLPAHGLPIEGRARIATVLGDIAGALETLVGEVVTMMNAGATLDEIIHSVSVPADVLAKPYLRPYYDEPEFVVRNVWRLYGGWWDGAASRLKPAPDAAVGAEIAALAGGADVLAARATALAEAGDLRLACHLADWAAWAAPDDAAVHGVRAEIYQRRRDAEMSLMSKGIFKAASRESEAAAMRLRGESPATPGSAAPPATPGSATPPGPPR
jgi:glyoxylase-like metal-dependent hydrolase (beta-lactamase superfamily II)